MTTTIGRAGISVALPNPMLWTRRGGTSGTLRLVGKLSPADALVLRDQLTAYQDNGDETIVPVIVDSESRLTGYYKVASVSLDTDAALTAKGLVIAELSLEPVQAFTQPVLESVLLGTRRATSFATVDGDAQSFHALPRAASEILYSATGYTFATRYSEDGPLAFNYQSGTAAGGNGYARFGVAPRYFYVGAATFEQGSPLRAVVGRQTVQPDVSNWRLSNGLVRVTPSPSEPAKIDVSHYQAVFQDDFEALTAGITLWHSLGTEAGTDNSILYWLNDMGAAPSYAAHLMTLPAGSGVHGGHPDTGNATFRTRFVWATNSVPRCWAHTSLGTGGTLDNGIFCQTSGAANSFSAYKVVGGVLTGLGSGTHAALVNGTAYWFEIACNGPSYSLSLYADAAGAIGALIVTLGATVRELVLQTGFLHIDNIGSASYTVGGAFANVCTIVGELTSSWTPQVIAGEPAFALSPLNPYGGRRSLSIYNAHANGQGQYAQNVTDLGVNYVAVAAMKGSGNPLRFCVTTFNGPQLNGAVGPWTVYTGTMLGAGSDSFYLVGYGIGTYYFDDVRLGRWLPAKTYRFEASGTVIDQVTSVVVLQNNVAESRIRLTGINAALGFVFGVGTLDLSLRRGDNVVRCYLSTGLAVNMRLARDNIEAATALAAPFAAGAIRATANDAEGHRYVLMSYAAAVTEDLTNGRLTTTSAVAAADFGIGYELNGSAATAPNDAQSLARQYLAAIAETQRVVAR